HTAICDAVVGLERALKCDGAPEAFDGQIRNINDNILIISARAHHNGVARDGGIDGGLNAGVDAVLADAVLDNVDFVLLRKTVATAFNRQRVVAAVADEIGSRRQAAKGIAGDVDAGLIQGDRDLAGAREGVVDDFTRSSHIQQRAVGRARESIAVEIDVTVLVSENLTALNVDQLTSSGSGEDVVLKQDVALFVAAQHRILAVRRRGLHRDAVDFDAAVLALKIKRRLLAG